MNISYSCRRMTSPTVIACLAVVASLGCGTPTDPRDVLTVDLTVTPSSIRPGDSLLVTLTIVNPTIRSIQLSSGDSCVALPEVYSAGERLLWDGARMPNRCVDVYRTSAGSPHSAVSARGVPAGVHSTLGLRCPADTRDVRFGDEYACGTA